MKTGEHGNEDMGTEEWSEDRGTKDIKTEV